VSFHWDHRPKYKLIVVLPSELITKSVVCLIYSNKFFWDLLVIRIVFRVVLNRESSVSIFNLVQRCISIQAQNRVIILEWIWIVFLQKFLLLLSFWSVLIEKSFKSRVRILEIIFSSEKLIIIWSFISVGKDIICFSYFLKSDFSRLSMLFIFVRMPLCCKFLISTLDINERGVLINSKYFVIIFDRLVWSHRRNTFVFNYSIVKIISIYII
jgi:hypothetical protein